ncbi:MAG: hypothetical protein LKE46_07775 [Clostridium sp.]|jgi:hypothetical protein|uniref:hypothetical protein n=1 Tax=Clostridium sp. TaxID=1506 RepID=UPI0025B9DBE2|nr:hypothetical protein [Clostridium sp.]MCH3964162.1 hypothetical protein [Clostridium sp.]MCI1715343.1 hypothetical protein [Clostridium sp.]MCI1799866.1 hypothetical protein [Clostridium sp.]MCI1813526.1 hypothetical protein [Clostridium sp.]MCI1870684.1 hypothetical protein [Clostridium sp.]
MWKTAVCELNEGSITIKDRGDVKDIFKINEISSIKMDLKHRSVLILIHGEELYVENMALPRTGRKYIYGLIEDRLKDKFKNIDNMMFSYKIWNKNKFEFNLTVLCINHNYSEVIKKFSDNKINIKGMVPVQIYVMDKYKHSINKKSYILVVCFETETYFIACYENNIVFSGLFKVKSKNQLLECVDEFNLKLNILIPNIKFHDMEFVNLPYKDIFKDLENNYSCSDLGEFAI